MIFCNVLLEGCFYIYFFYICTPTFVLYCALQVIVFTAVCNGSMFGASSVCPASLFLTSKQIL